MGALTAHSSAGRRPEQTPATLGRACGTPTGHVGFQGQAGLVVSSAARQCQWCSWSLVLPGAYHI